MRPTPHVHRWKKSPVAWWLDPAAKFADLDREAVLAALAWAWAQWESVCKIKVICLPEPPSSFLPDVLISTAPIDGPGGMVSWSEMADGDDTPRRIVFDEAEEWTIGDVDHGVNLGSVALHEIAHCLGLHHVRRELAVMNPRYNRLLTRLQPADIEAAIALYGLPIKPSAAG